MTTTTTPMLVMVAARVTDYNDMDNYDNDIDYTSLMLMTRIPMMINDSEDVYFRS